MDSSRDNPITRFATFWWGIGTFFIFAALLGVVWLFNLKKPETMEDAGAKKRYEFRAMTDEAQASFLTAAEIDSAVEATAKALAGSAPVAIEKPEQIVPGSATAQRLAESGPVDTSAIDEASAGADEPIDPAVMELGKGQYLVCGACHGQNGEGTPAGPPLASSEWVTGPISNLILIQLRGLTGPITVAGKEYNFPAGMTPMAYQNDEQIAAVLTFIRNSFGNEGSAVKPEQVSALRGEVGKPQLTADELIQP